MKKCFFSKSIEDYENGHELALDELSAFNPSVIREEKIYLKRKNQNIETDIIFTTSKGIFHLNGTNRILQIAQGVFYGLAFFEKRWYVTRSNQQGKRNFLLNERFSHIYTFDYSNLAKPLLIPVIRNIPKELHQIDVVDGNLVIPHTGYPQLLRIRIDTSLHRIKSVPFDFADLECYQFPLDQFCHLNSIIHRGGKCYLIAHNYTAKSGKGSDLIITDNDFNLLEVIPLNAHSAHNLFFYRDEIVFCDSQNKKLRSLRNIYFEADLFLRGLSINPSHIFIGGSPVNMQTLTDESGSSKIYILNRDLKLVDEIELSGIGKIYEIRQSSGVDLAMSLP